ncbi:178b9d30-eecb-4b68-aabd-a9fefff89e21 [Thermothielavioides terrestris]|uniref:178b9d30-eecb-4b68-aabd-a9fefff89e21 n=1 Tax=Thermothielavioides terrestris TaxID=2587410 RepID=A0A446BBJ7_9PEZI|nr:178b9d30-eecb-4b68-aabd-a9fefff89e21 [Thermothielavioides terrestris]
MSERGPGKEQLSDIAQQAERDLNTYQSKTGTGKGRVSGLEDYGVNETVERKFPGATVKVGENLVTNRSYDRPIPANEGGDVDERGRYLQGSAYEGAGGPEDKTAHVYQHSSGKIDEATVKGWGKDPRQLEGETVRADRPDLLPADQALGGRGREPAKQGDVSEQGRLAAKANVGLSAESGREVPAQGSRGSQFKGEYYESPESVPDQGADQNLVPPESATETSRNI